MKFIKVTTDEQGMELMAGAAAYHQLPLSVWARTVLLAEARSVNHKVLCETPRAEKERKYKWAGLECTKEVYEAKSAEYARDRGTL